MFERTGRADEFTAHVHQVRATNKRRPALQGEFAQAWLP